MAKISGVIILLSPLLPARMFRSLFRQKMPTAKLHRISLILSGLKKFQNLKAHLQTPSAEVLFPKALLWPRLVYMQNLKVLTLTFFTRLPDSRSFIADEWATSKSSVPVATLSLIHI